MDSPGNDLEGMAGQVGSGCNILMFTTGNGAITNFPFVPTIKVVTTTKRFNLMSKDLDLNAGQFQDGSKTMAELGRIGYAYLLSIASGQRSTGERNGIHQVQLWRNWNKTANDEEDVAEKPIDPCRFTGLLFYHSLLTLTLAAPMLVWSPVPLRPSGQKVALLMIAMDLAMVMPCLFRIPFLRQPSQKYLI